MGNNTIRFVASVFLALLTLAGLVLVKSGDVRRFMGGGLSLKHQALATDCTVCHTPWRNVSDDKCKKCHDRAGSHLAPSAEEDKRKAVEGVVCMDCHVEHKGPDIRVSFPGSVMCGSCHDHAVHPEIKKRPIMKKPEPNRAFPHSIHKDRAPSMKMEKCGDCHIDTDGKGTLGYNAAQLNAGNCRPCHYGNAELGENAVPVHYVNKAVFKHARHGGFDCLRCHKDILNIPELSEENLPSVAKCMECHNARTGTTCVKCHGFHLVAVKKKG
ncbi:MAG: cytochrome c3 family protein [Nitrospinae bacterium]|nr:cytochrome c3 family protein [Nitrospinota bacterium]